MLTITSFQLKVLVVDADIVFLGNPLQVCISGLRLLNLRNNMEEYSNQSAMLIPPIQILDDGKSWPSSSL